MAVFIETTGMSAKGYSTRVALFVACIFLGIGLSKAFPDDLTATVYAGGYSTMQKSAVSPDAPEHLSIPGYWKNGTWVALSNPLSSYAEVSSLAVSGQDVYAGGSISKDNVDIPGYWKNGTWVELDSLDKAFDSKVSTLAVVREQ